MKINILINQSNRILVGVVEGIAEGGVIRSSTQPTGLRIVMALNVLRTPALRFTFLVWFS